MSTELKPYPEFKETYYKPVSFAVSAVPDRGAALAFPQERQMTQAIAQRQPSALEQQHDPVIQQEPLRRVLFQSTQNVNYEPILHPYPVTQPVTQNADQSAQLAPIPERTSAPTAAVQADVAVAPKTRRAHLVQTMGLVKWSTMALASTLFAAAFTTYGWTVALEQHGSDLNSRLTQLREHEEGMIGMTTALGASTADDARNPASGLHLPGPGSILTLELALPRPLATERSNFDDTRQTRTNHPKGY